MALPVILRGQGATIAVKLPEGDFAGVTIRLEVCGLSYEWPSPASGETLHATFLSADTARLPLGAHFGRLTASFPAGESIISETVRLVVTDDVEAAGGTEYTIDVSGGEGFHPDLSGIDADPATPNELRAAFQTLLQRLRDAAGAGVALAMLLAGTALADGRVVAQTAASGDLPWNAPVVTNVVVEGELGLGAEAVTNIAEYVTASATNGLLRVEEDPTVPYWAKAPNPPEPVELDPVFLAWRDDSTAVFAGTAYNATFAESANYAYTAYSAESAGYADSAGTASYAEEAGHASGASHAEEAAGVYWSTADTTLHSGSQIAGVAHEDAVALLAAFAATNPPPDLSNYATRADLAAATQRVARASSSLGWATGPLALTVGASLSADLAGWPDGGAVFVRLSASGPYTVAPSLALLGYGDWPTNSASCVAVRDGQRVLVNVLEGN